jgi:C4-dicarboxylate-binding protein DctP
MKAVRIFLALLAFALCGAAAAADAPIIIKFSHVNGNTSPKNLAAEYFKKLAEERTKGRVKVEVYPNSTLYKDAEEIQALQMGSVQMLAPTLGKFGPLGVRQFEVFDLPYLFDNFDDVHHVTQGPIGKKLFAALEPQGIKGLAYWDNGFKEMNANKPLRNVSDFRGIKLRIFSSKVLDAQMRALGAIPQTLAASEIYTSMQTGLVDGGENTLSTFNDFKFYEVQKFLTLSDHGYVGYAVVVNKKFWEGLPPDIRAILDQAMVETTAFANQSASNQNAAALEGIKKSGKTEIIALTPDEKRAWKKALLPVHQEAEPKVGKDLLQAIYKETGFDPKKL